MKCISIPFYWTQRLTHLTAAVHRALRPRAEEPSSKLWRHEMPKRQNDQPFLSGLCCSNTINNHNLLSEIRSALKASPYIVFPDHLKKGIFLCLFYELLVEELVAFLSALSEGCLLLREQLNKKKNKNMHIVIMLMAALVLERCSCTAWHNLQSS